MESASVLSSVSSSHIVRGLGIGRGLSKGLFLKPKFSHSVAHGASCKPNRFVVRGSMGFGEVESTVQGLAASSKGFLFLLSDAATEAVSSAVGDSVGAAAETTSTFVKTEDWLSGLSDLLENILKLLEGGLSSLHVPYAYGFSIILLTILVKAATYPLTKQQVESTMAMQSLQPKLKAIQNRYAGDQERIQLETARLYKQAGVNPLAGCLPTLATLPVWIGLYRALSNAANEGILTEGFFWIPSLSGPTSLGSAQGASWLFSWINGAPALGWSNTLAYLVLPVLLVVSQYLSMKLMQPVSSNSDDPAQKNTQLILQFLPLMIGYFSLSVPSGLSLYWFTNNILSTAQQLYLKKGGGASAPSVEIIEAGQAKRSSTPASIATDEEKERLRGERFRQLKEAEAAKKAAAKRAAEEASLAAATSSSTSSDSSPAQDEGDEESEEESTSNVPAGTNGATLPKSSAKRSKRSKRTKNVA